MQNAMFQNPSLLNSAKILILSFDHSPFPSLAHHIWNHTTMNASSNSRNDIISDSDSDTNSDEIADYYQPISSFAGDEDGDASNPNINGYHDHHQYDSVNQNGSLTNGHCYSVAAVAENGVRSLNLSEDDEEKESEEVEEEETRRMELDSAMRRAFEEDESRRNAPISSENAARVMEAMRGVSFSGMPPDWVRQVPEDGWVHQLQRLRQPPRSSA